MKKIKYKVIIYGLDKKPIKNNNEIMLKRNAKKLVSVYKAIGFKAKIKKITKEEFLK